MDNEYLLLYEIYFSIQGESSYMGLPCIFIRLAGCPARCQYCDTEHAFNGGQKTSIAEILNQIQAYHCSLVLVTGGEPMAQKNCIILMKQLILLKYKVILETGGIIDLKNVPQEVIKVVDIKTPASGELNSMIWDNLNYIKPHDEIKFVICNQEDYQWSKQIIKNYNLSEKSTVLMSPSFNELKAEQLAQWILSDQLNVRMQLQLHKYIWDPTSRGV